MTIEVLFAEIFVHEGNTGTFNPRNHALKKDHVLIVRIIYSNVLIHFMSLILIRNTCDIVTFLIRRQLTYLDVCKTVAPLELLVKRYEGNKYFCFTTITQLGPQFKSMFSLFQQIQS